MNASGTNTATSVSAIAMIGPLTSRMAWYVASLADKPASMFRSTFSTTTIASSTTIPIASTIPNSDSALIENPNASSSEKVKNAVSESRGFILEKFTDLCRSAGASDPVLLGKQLVLLYDGAATSAYVDGNRNATAAARALAAQVLVLHNLTPKK